GNGGAHAPAVYPAAEPGVVAVTAVDAVGRRYRHANTGEYIDVAAPGVDLWLANSQGSGSYRSGSSYATAFVTAFMALQAQSGAINWADNTRDLGEAGRDHHFGWGLLQWPQTLPTCD
ncbi:MAG TPA: S8 family serine peptidase, partial [Cellvibrionaceae bacterium]